MNELIEKYIYYPKTQITNSELYNLIKKYLSDNGYYNFDFYLKYNGKLIENTNIKKFSDDIIYNNFVIIDIYYRVRGGGLGEIFDSVIEIANFFLLIPTFFEWLIKMVIWLSLAIAWIIGDLLNPINFVKDVINGLIAITFAICKVPFTMIYGFISWISNEILNKAFGGFWGWDNAKNAKSDETSKYFKNKKKSRKNRCYSPNGDKIPFSVLLGTIICPPIGVYLEYGLMGYINIIICILLTVLYYIPGLIYALICIYR